MKIAQFKSRKEWSAAVWRKLLEDIKNPELSIVLDSLLGPYEKSIIVNRLAASALIRSGKTYRQIGKELWLSPSTISALKKTLADNLVRGYKSRRTNKNQRGNNKRIEISKGAPEHSPFWARLDFYIENFPRKNGPRWKWVR